MRRTFFNVNANKIFIVLLLFTILAGGSSCYWEFGCMPDLPGIACFGKYWTCNEAGQCEGVDYDDNDRFNELYEHKHGIEQKSTPDVQRPGEHVSPDEPAEKDVELGTDKGTGATSEGAPYSGGEAIP